VIFKKKERRAGMKYFEAGKLYKLRAENDFSYPELFITRNGVYLESYKGMEEIFFSSSERFIMVNFSDHLLAVDDIAINKVGSSWGFRFMLPSGEMIFLRRQDSDYVERC
jgi:hypothetical protein